MQTVRDAVKSNITQSQFDMLTSLCFNIGSGAFKNSTVVRVINEGDFDKVPNAFMMWVKAGGKVVQGLVNRRQAEAANFRGATTAPA
jgi:lysozyme